MPYVAAVHAVPSYKALLRGAVNKYNTNLYRNEILTCMSNEFETKSK